MTELTVETRAPGAQFARVGRWGMYSLDDDQALLRTLDALASMKVDAITSVQSRRAASSDFEELYGAPIPMPGGGWRLIVIVATVAPEQGPTLIAPGMFAPAGRG